MSINGPYTARVGLFQRSPHLIDLLVRNNPGVKGYRLWASRSVNDAYGDLGGAAHDSGVGGTGGLLIMEADVKKVAASPSVVRRGSMLSDVLRDQTRFAFDVDDYIVPAAGPLIPEVPSDDEFVYVRVQENRANLGWLSVDGGATKNAGAPYLGPILIVPTAPFFGRAAAVLAFSGLAPAGTGCVDGSVPVYDPSMQNPPPMHVVMPRPMGSLTIHNTEAVGGDDLLITFGAGMPMIKIPPQGSSQPTGGGYSLPGITEFIIAKGGAGAGACSFAIEGVIGLQA